MTESNRTALSTTLVALVFLTGANPAVGQYVEPGHTRAVITDVSGPSVTSGDQLAGLFAPGSVQTFSCPVAWGVRTTASSVISELRSGTLSMAMPGDPPVSLSASVATPLLSLVTNEDDDEAEDWLVTELTRPGNDSPAVRRQADRLADDMKEILSAAAQMDPDAPGYLPATRVSDAVRSFNRLIEASSPDFLASPPMAFLAVRAILSRVVVASLEHQGRTTFEDDGVTTVSCAPPRPPIPVGDPIAERPLPPPDTAIEICVLPDGVPTRVAAIIEGASLDTVVIENGARRPITRVYPSAYSFASGMEWYRAGEAIVINGVQYERWGIPFEPRPSTLRRVDEYEGVPVLSSASSDTPEVVYLPVSQGCLVQEFRTLEEIRRARG